MILRQARAGDGPAVRALLASSELPADCADEDLSEGYVVAESGGAVLGAAGVEVYGEHGLLRSVVVSPALRGGGIGEALVRDRIGWARERGLR